MIMVNRSNILFRIRSN